MNRAKDYANGLVEIVHKVEFMYQLSREGHVDGKLANDYIERNVNEIDGHLEDFKGYIELREDMM